MLLKKSYLFEYQRELIINFIKKGSSLINLSCGAGKTIIGLSLAQYYLKNNLVDKCLILSTPAILDGVWQNESLKWEHTNHLTFGVVTNKTKQDEIYKNDIIMCSFNQKDNLFKIFDFDKRYFLIVDESTFLANASSKRFGSARAFRNQPTKELIKKHRDSNANTNALGFRHLIYFCNYRLCLTGTFLSNDYLKIYSQIYMCDGGKRLGSSYSLYLNTHFNKLHNFKYVLKSEEEKKIISNKIKDVVMVCKLTSDVKKSINTIYLDKDKAVDPIVKELKRNMQYKKNDFELLCHSNSVLLSKLIQLNNGFIYDNEKNILHFNDNKILKLNDLHDKIKKPFLITYQFIHTVDRLKLLSKNKRIVEFKNYKLNEILNKLKNNEIDYLVLHPLSAGHGVDGLQHYIDTIVWLTPNYSYELTFQLNSRIIRKGQLNEVNIYYLLTDNIIEKKVLQASRQKFINESELLKFILGSQGHN